MSKDPKKITEQIISLVNELAELAGARTKKFPVLIRTTKRKVTGATGGLRSLIDEGSFDSPKQLPEIVDKLRQEGRHYSQAAVSMGLLNLVRERILTRFKEKKGKIKIWKYVIRK